MEDPTRGDTPAASAVIFDRGQDSYRCPHCEHTMVPTDEWLPDLRVEHDCPGSHRD